MSDYLGAVQGKMNILGNRQGRLQTLLGERQFSRGLAAQNYNDAAQRRNALKAMIQQKQAGLEFFGDAAGQYFLENGELSPASAGSPWSVVAGQNDTNYLLNQKTGALQQAIDPTTGEPIQEKSFMEKLQESRRNN
jgi:hypothetical protein